MRLLFLLVLLLASPQARAASFDCARAATVTEHAICASPALSALDDRALAAYTATSQALGLADADFKNPMANLFLQGHQDWTAARNRCGAASPCLMAQYLRRLAELNFHPDPQAPSPLDAVIGRYGTSVLPDRELLIMRAPGDAVLVHVTVASSEGRCEFGGIGRLDRGGTLVVRRPDFDGAAAGDHTVLLKPTRLGLELSHASKADNVSAHFCAAALSLEQPFPREK